MKLPSLAARLSAACAASALASLLLAAPASAANPPVNICDPVTFVCASVTAGGALSISGSFSASLGAFQPTGQTSTLAAGTTSANTSIGSASTVLVANLGANTAYVAFGSSSSSAATTSGLPVLPGQEIALSPGSGTYIAAITGSGTTSLTVTPGLGLPSVAFQSGGTSGGGGPVYGADTVGAAPSHSPLYAGGIGTDGYLHGALMDTAGRAFVNVYSLPALAAGANLIGYTGDMGLGTSGSNTQVNVTNLGALLPPETTSAAGKTITKTALTAATSTTICPAVSSGYVVAEEIQVSGAAGLGLLGEALSSASYGTATGTPDLVLASAGALYTLPVPTTSAITAYSSAAITAICIQTLRQ